MRESAPRRVHRIERPPPGGQIQVDSRRAVAAAVWIPTSLFHARADLPQTIRVVHRCNRRARGAVLQRRVFGEQAAAGCWSGASPPIPRPGRARVDPRQTIVSPSETCQDQGSIRDENGRLASSLELLGGVRVSEAPLDTLPGELDRRVHESQQALRAPAGLCGSAARRQQHRRSRPTATIASEGIAVAEALVARELR